MPDEESGATATATGTTPSSTTGQTTGGGHGGGGLGGNQQQSKLPAELRPGQSDPDPMSIVDGKHPPRWITYLQQMLNYHYQTLVCNDNGEFDDLTVRAVIHFAEQNGARTDGIVDIPFWNKLGVEDAPDKPQGQQGGQHGGGQLIASDHNASLVDLPDSSMTWASSLATVLNSKGNSYTVDSLCEFLNTAKEQKSWSEVSAFGVNQSMNWVRCNGNTAEAWAGALQHGLLWVPHPSNDTHMIVVAGIRQSGDHAEIHVLDAEHNTDVWVTVHEFTEYYGMTEGYYGEFLAMS